MLFRVENVYKFFGTLAAVNGISFRVQSGDILGIAGPNGAGKTTLFNIITNMPYSLSSGRIIFQDKEIHSLRPHEICRMGIVRTFQIPVIFEGLSYLENVVVGEVFGSAKKNPKEENGRMHRSIEALDQVGLLPKKDNPVKGAPLYDVKRLMIASAIATNPKLLLLDEPIGGLTKYEIEQTLRLFRKINEEGVTIVIIEHVMTALVRICQRLMILDYGQKICEGTPAEVIKDERVTKAYLGEKYAELVESEDQHV